MSKSWLRPRPANKFPKIMLPILVCTLSGASIGNAGSKDLKGTANPISLDQQAQAILSRLDLSAKVGQMIQGELLNVKEAIKNNEHPVRDLGLGSVLAGGNSIITDNSPAGWRSELSTLQAEAIASANGIPLLLGVDAVHGHAIVLGATVFPHNIGLGATRNPKLLQQIGSVVAKEVLSTGFNWTFAPAVSVARDVRWGRSYESLGETAELQQQLTGPFIRGLQETPVDNITLSATAKHFIGDGGTVWGTGFKSYITGEVGIDRGDTQANTQDLIALHGQGYVAAIKANVDTVMISYNSVNGVRMHENGQLINSYLKAPKSAGGLEFKGLVISDWNAIDDIPIADASDPLQRFKTQLVTATNAGIDMFMVSEKIDISGSEKDTVFRFDRAHQFLMEAVNEGLIPLSRIDDAVSRILKIKIKTGIVANAKKLALSPLKVNEEILGQSANRQVARAAVRETLVLLKNDADTLPISRSKYKIICVAGAKADDFGAQAGAWTTGWQGTNGNVSKTPGAKTILDGLRAEAAAAGIPLVYEADGAFTNSACSADKSLRLAVVGEQPYAEFLGDSSNLVLQADDSLVVKNVQSAKGATAVVLISGRPLIITKDIAQWQALVAAWLPGSQGEGVSDVLFGKFNFTGKLSQSWPVSMDQLPFANRDEALFPYGFGLQYGPYASNAAKSSSSM